jgi:ABC-type multidrug transport system ATPase subunit/streptogramin lyase
LGITSAEQGVVRFMGKYHLRPRLWRLAADGIFFLPDRGLFSSRMTLRAQLELVASRFGAADLPEIAAKLEVTHLLDRLPTAVSGGERRRAELAMAVARDPHCLIADEPLAEVEPKGRLPVMAMLREVADRGAAVLMTGHEVHDMFEIADEVIGMVAGTTHGLGTPAEAKQHHQFRREYLGPGFEKAVEGVQLLALDAPRAQVVPRFELNGVEIMRRSQRISAALMVALVAIGCADQAGTDTATVATPGVVPSFTVDPSWPLEMPDDWIMGSITAVFVDGQDHVWVTHLRETLTPEEISAVQDPPIGECCRPAPVVVEFDAEGRVVQGWGDPETQDVSEFPRNPHGLFVDHNDNVWVGSYQHHRVMKFTREGALLMTLGEYDVNAGSNDERLLGGPAGIWVDPVTNEVFIADGYRNRRVVVFDGDTGAYLRHWGAYGEVPDDAYRYDYANYDPENPPREFSTVHGLVGSRDGLIYVADRRGNRIQVFQKDGTFVTEKIIAPKTLASGSSFVIAFSPDEAQEWLYLADGTNHKVWVLRRSDLEVVGDFGRGGRQVGQFLRPHGMSVDSRGNIYVGEASTGRRVQKFTVGG